MRKKLWVVAGIQLTLGFLLMGTGSFGCGKGGGENEEVDQKKDEAAAEPVASAPSRPTDNAMTLPDTKSPSSAVPTAGVPTTTGGTAAPATTPSTGSTATPVTNNAPTPPKDAAQPNPIPTPTAPAGPDPACASLFPAEELGGCRIRLVTPSPCEVIDFSGNLTYEFAWSTDTTYCETPYKLQIAGNPPSEQNIWEWSLSEKVGEISKTGGGIKYITAQDLNGITSDNGTYHWRVLGFYGSHPASQVFKVKR